MIRNLFSSLLLSIFLAATLLFLVFNIPAETVQTAIDPGAPVQAVGATYYVSLNGNDANDGRSEDTSFRTINRGAQAARAGDTVMVKPGNYGSETVTPAASGTSTNRIVIKAETLGTVTVEGGGSGTGFVVDSKSYITKPVPEPAAGCKEPRQAPLPLKPREKAS